MKKNFIFSLFALATMLFTASCSEQELVDPSLLNGDVVTFTVNLQQSASTRAALAGSGAHADKLYYGVYEATEVDADGNGTAWQLIPAISAAQDKGKKDPADISTGNANVEIKLAKQKLYSVIFWATNENNDVCDVDWLNRTMTMKATGATANNEANDAFWAHETVRLNGAVAKTVDLYRPFAQLNIGTSIADFDDAAKAELDVAQSQVVVKGVPNKLDLATGRATGKVDQTYEFANIPNMEVYNFPVDARNYRYLALAYVLVDNDEDKKMLVDVDFACEETTGNDTYNRTFTAVPVQLNYRTNIYGNLLTNSADYDVNLQPEFGTPDQEVYVWDGEEIKEPEYNVEKDIYEITYASELAWLAAAVNGTLLETRAVVEPEANDFAGKTFKLTKDIDLGGKEWTPIGSSGKIFKGTLDGQGHTVKNLFISGYNSNVGLFGVTQEGEIKDLTVENAKVSGRLNVGVVAGQPYTSKYTNITVKGHVEVNGLAYVGGVGGKNAYADWTNIKVEADETSYVNANSVENGNAYRTYVGGVVGFNGEGPHKFSNITSNIDVKGSTCDVGGLFGIAHYGNKFENCACTGDVEIYAAEEADEAEQIGGIAGVWHNGGEDVVLTDCSFTGTLQTNIDDINFYYGGLVGKPYSNEGNGKLLIGGKHYVASSSELQSVLNAATTETTIYLGHDIEGGVTVVQKQGVKITVDGEGKKFNGSIKVHSNSNHYADAALTVKNVNFTTSVASTNFIEALENGSERYSTNITVENCTFTATVKAENTAVGVQIKASKNAKVLNCTATGVHSLLQAQSCDETVVVTNCKINGKNGVAFKQVKAATVEGTTITALEYGIRFDGNTDNYGIKVKDNNVTAVQPFIVRKMTGKDNTITLEGKNTLTTEEEYQIVITNGSDDEKYVKPTGTYTLTGADSYTVYPRDYYFQVASWDEFTAALAANEPKIKLTDNINNSSYYQLKKDVVIDLNGKSITMPMFYVFSTATIMNGTINGKMYARTGCKATLEGLTFSGTISDDLSTEGHLQVQGSCDVYAKNCTFAATTVNGSQTRSLSIEASSSGIRKFEGCDFKFVSWGNGAGKYKKNVYVNTMNGTTTVDFTDCKLNGKAPNILFAGTYSLKNLTMSGCDNTAPTLEISRAKDTVTEEEWAHISSLIANNKFTQVRVFYAGGSSEYIR